MPPAPNTVIVNQPRSVVWPMLAAAMVLITGGALFLVWRQMQDQKPAEIKITQEKDPANLPWKALGCQIALESTGFFTNKDSLQKHITAGADRVILSAGSGQSKVSWSFQPPEDAEGWARDVRAVLGGAGAPADSVR